MAFFKLAVASLVLFFHGLVVNANTVIYDWNITWTTANPDGMLERPVIGINGHWPLPVLNLTKGDRVIANVYNGLGNESTSIHWHGFFHNGTNEMDGPPHVVQCDIAPGSTFTYNFTLEQSGLYWYHSHTRGQYPDGLRQAFIITDPENPYLGQYDKELVVTLSDWYHDEMPGLLKHFISVANPTGAEPVPKSALMNETQNFEIPVEPGKTYLLRLVNIGAFASQYFWIEGHNVTIVEVDGVWTKPAEAKMIYLTSAQRYSVLVTMKNDTTRNYPMVGSMDTDLFDVIPSDLNYNVTGYLVYDKGGHRPQPYVLDAFDPYDDFNLEPTDGIALYENPDQVVVLNMSMNNLGDGANYAFFNDITYVAQKVPTLYSVLTSGSAATNPVIYGRDTNTYVLGKGQTIDVILNNMDTGKHPFHLHGHNFQVLYRSPDDEGFFNSTNTTSFPAVPMRRDTFMARPTGNFLIRFKADNPGVWLFHCHLQFHLDAGLMMTFVEAPLAIQETIKIPQNHYDVCKASGELTAGNAAGNTVDLFDLTGENRSVDPLPAGFTTKGTVALVFSCIAAFLGMAAVAWYGAAPIGAPTIPNTQ
ncbi:putative ferrooxidoreductase Fet3 [Phyllosticta citrichinensis]|uniref:Ferrooxidoreductase Fet3 n=1 Tax=Phyllosticta citrichinensis TaxID=1130410 RepID=A0ABR1XJ79_9PEZI